MTDLAFSDSVVVALDADRTYALLSDVTRMGQWSPVCTACWWDDEAQAGQVGAWFTGRNELSESRSEATGDIVPARTWETRSQVVAADPGREFAWEVNDGWVRWGFTLEPATAGAQDGGTRVTQSWQFLPKGIEGFRGRFGDDADRQIALRSEQAKSGIPATLAAIKATADAG